MGICTKCGEYKLVQDHHINGYEEDHINEVVPYCISCDKLAHLKARKDGRCTMDSKEIHKISTKSSKRRYNKEINKKILLSWETLEPFICIREILNININSENIVICSYFSAMHGKKIKYIDI